MNYLLTPKEEKRFLASMKFKLLLSATEAANKKYGTSFSVCKTLFYRRPTGNFEKQTDYLERALKTLCICVNYLENQIPSGMIGDFDLWLIDRYKSAHKRYVLGSTHFNKFNHYLVSGYVDYPLTLPNFLEIN